MFAAVLNYINVLKMFNEIPKHVDFDFDISGEITPSIESLIRNNIEKPLDYVIDNVLTNITDNSDPVIVGRASEYGSYFRAIENKKFLIIGQSKGTNGITKEYEGHKIFFDRKIILDQKDAFIVLEAIYVFSKNKGVLNKIYKQAKEFYKIKKGEDEQILCVF